MRLLPMLTSSLLACVSLLGGGLAAPLPAAAASAVSCTETDLPVSVPTPHETVHGQLCLPAGRVPRTVQLLVHGGPLNRMYWDFPYQTERYSYQRDMAGHGYATFAVDRLGTGKSTKPLSVTLLDTVEAESIHQVIGQLRAGRAGVHFDHVVLVGHSLGSGVSVREAATYHDVDGVILTGMTHLVSTPTVAKIFTMSVYPVTLDPQLRRRGSDPGYITTIPGTRGPLFFSSSDADPQVIATDEATKDQLSAFGLGTIILFDFLGPTSRGINVPVLLAVGEKDAIFCGFLARDCSTAETLRKQEAPYFSRAAELTTYVLPSSGHNLALHKNSDLYRDATRAWLRERFAP